SQQQKLQGLQSNQMSSSLIQQLQPNGVSFQMDNMTFSHHTASVNGIQMHYVIGGKGDGRIPEYCYHLYFDIFFIGATAYQIIIRYDEIIDLIKSKSNPKAVAGMAKFGINVACAYGVSIPFLRSVAKMIGKKNHNLAQQLWFSGIHEARLLATMIDD